MGVLRNTTAGDRPASGPASAPAGGPAGGRAGPRAGFSLIEVLIAVLILALGLLGLGAVFPVVIREQRAGTDATTSLLSANAAEAYLTGQPPVPGDDQNPQFWRALRSSLAQDGLGTWSLIRTPAGDVSDLDFGPWTIPLAERLYPSPDTGNDPQYVWDIAFGRAVDPRTDATEDHDSIRVAVFIRRMDPRMRLEPDRTLRSALLDRGIPATQQRVPVAADINNVPTYDGLGDRTPRYSLVVETPIQFVFDSSSGDFHFRDRIHRATPAGPDPSMWPMLAQVGQQFVDNMGNIYTVVRVGVTGNTPWVQVDPPVPASVTEDRAASNPGGYGTDELIRQAILVPQVPAGVRVFTVPVEDAP
jgi:prepilin-type N-terminal cleavage/methylation domain-containing protein